MAIISLKTIIFSGIRNEKDMAFSLFHFEKDMAFSLPHSLTGEEKDMAFSGGKRHIPPTGGKNVFFTRFATGVGMDGL